MSDPNPPQPGPYGAPGGGQPPPPYGQQPPPYTQQPPPYGQQPTGPQDYPAGQQDYPTGQQPEYPPAPPGQPVRKSSKKKIWLIVGIVVVALVVGGVLVSLLNKNSASKAEAGDCIKVNSATNTSADVEKIDCNDKVAVFKVAKKLGNDTDQCPTPDYEKYTQRGGGSNFALCLMLNAKEGDCFANIEDPAKRARVDCANGEFKVSKVVNKADEAACGGEGQPIVYPEPATTFCLTQP
jgi:hypothetical protein